MDSRAYTVRGSGSVRGGGEEADEAAESEGKREEEARAPSVKARPEGPTQREREGHNKTHLPHKAWYPHCVAAAGCSSHRSENGLCFYGACGKLRERRRIRGQP